MKMILTLCIVLRENKILLGIKKRGFGKGLWNGFGGKVEKGETIESATIRELREESGIEAKEIKKVGILDFSFENNPELLEIHIFKVTDFDDEPIESEEMKPQWFNFDEIPFLKMWPDDKYWLPYVLKGELFKGNFLLDRPSDSNYSAKIIKKKISKVQGF